MTALVNVLLDETGSMHAMAAEVISGYNKYIEDLEKSGEQYLVTTVKFDTAHYTALCERARIGGMPAVAEVHQVTRLSVENYRPGASTNLYDSITRMINETSMEGVETVIMMVYTDGQENASSVATAESVNALIKAKEAEGWVFMYLGASVEAWANEHMLRGTMAGSNVLRSSGGAGTQAMYASASSATVNRVASVRMGGRAVASTTANVVNDDMRTATLSASGLDTDTSWATKGDADDQHQHHQDAQAPQAQEQHATQEAAHTDSSAPDATDSGSSDSGGDSGSTGGGE